MAGPPCGARPAYPEHLERRLERRGGNARLVMNAPLAPGVTTRTGSESLSRRFPTAQ